ncbi:glutaminyl-peptide cyclotransferase [Flavobacterium sp. LB2R40]|uniref:glutaminyl-peptide cyclotransferase n=1 Tax=Flavobacterium sp. LB2R40 TaxID=3401722 RepID=UPI003AAC0CC3
MKLKFNSFFIIIICFCLIKCNKSKEINFNEEPENKINKNNISQEEYLILNIFPHDVNSFTEGLFIDNGLVYESTGSPSDLPNTKSLFGILDLKTGLINSKVELDRKIFFGEGIAKCNNKIYQLTYKNKIGFIYDSKTYKQVAMFQFDNDEGWGLTNVKNEALIMSDGTSNLTFLDPKSLNFLKKLAIFENNIPVLNLNELEYVDGYIYANVYTTNKIIKIDVSTGNVVKSYDLTDLYTKAINENSNSLEMNGIAYKKNSKTFFVTGKMWPLIYEVKLN